MIKKTRILKHWYLNASQYFYAVKERLLINRDKSFEIRLWLTLK
jgi:hypothetical protein